MGVLYEAVQQVYQWIIRPPGNVFYFLTTLSALQLAFFLALTAWRTAPRTALPRRWLWATGGLMLARVILIIVGLMATVGWLDPARVLPPLERWIELASVLLVLWAALLGARAARWQTVALVVLLVASLVFYGVTTLQWFSLESGTLAFNGLLFEQIWEILTLTFLLLTLLLAIILRPPEWEWLAGIVFFAFLGHTAQLRWPDTQVHFSGWLRLTTLVTLPLLAVLAQRQLFGRSAAAQVEVGALPEVDAIQDVLQGVESARELEPSLMIVSSKLAGLLDVEMCAIALTAEGETPSMRVVALHPPNAAQIEAPVLKLEDYPDLAKADAEGTLHIAQTLSQAPWLERLYHQLGIEQVGPLAAMPLHAQEQSIGMLLLGNPESGRRWRTSDGEVQQWVATLFAASVARARKQTQDKSLLARLRGQDAEFEKLQAALADAEQQLQAHQRRANVLEQEVNARDKEILQLNRELKAQAGQATETELTFWQDEVRQLAQERDGFQTQAQEAARERDQLKAQIQETQGALAQLQEAKRAKEKLQAQVQEAARDREMLVKERAKLAEQLSKLKARLDAEVEAREAQEEKIAELAQSAATPEPAPVAAGGTVTSGLVIVDADGQITMADAVARQMMRLPKGDVVGMPINGAYPDPRWTQAVGALLAKNVPNGLKNAHLTISVDDLAVEAELVKLTSRDGRTDGLAITLHSPESEPERQEALVSLANDFRTPMTAILGYTDLLLGEQAGILTEMQLQFLERVKANIEQMEHLLNDLVRTASPDSRPIELSPQSINLIEIIEEAIMGLAARFRERKLTVQLDLPPELPPVQADRDSLYQIMLRLISNAAQCSQQGSDVVISAQKDTTAKDGPGIRISVTDTGGGIAPEDQSRVFRRFYRASQALIQGMGETGVGMAVAKALVEANGGRIWVESKPGVGSTFSFVMPVFQG